MVEIETLPCVQMHGTRLHFAIRPSHPLTNCGMEILRHSIGVGDACRQRFRRCNALTSRQSHFAGGEPIDAECMIARPRELCAISRAAASTIAPGKQSCDVKPRRFSRRHVLRVSGLEMVTNSLLCRPPNERTSLASPGKGSVPAASQCTSSVASPKLVSVVETSGHRFHHQGFSVMATAIFATLLVNRITAVCPFCPTAQTVA